MAKRYGTPGPRVLRPEIATDPRLAKLSMQAQLLFDRLITQADDQGRQIGDIDVVKGACFPRVAGATPDHIEAWLSELADCRLIVRYECDDETMIQLSGWWKHQETQRRTYPSRWPAPPGWTDRVKLEEDRAALAGIAHASATIEGSRAAHAAGHEPGEAGRLDERDASGRPPAPEAIPLPVPVPLPVPLPVPVPNSSSLRSDAALAPATAARQGRTEADWLSYVVEEEPSCRIGTGGRPIGRQAERVARIGDYVEAHFGRAPNRDDAPRIAKLLKDHPGGITGLLRDLTDAGLRDVKGNPYDYVTSVMNRGRRSTPSRPAISGVDLDEVERAFIGG